MVVWLILRDVQWSQFLILSHTRLQLKGDKNEFIKETITLPCNGNSITLKFFKLNDKRYRFHGLLILSSPKV